MRFGDLRGAIHSVQRGEQDPLLEALIDPMDEAQRAYLLASITPTRMASVAMWSHYGGPNLKERDSFHWLTERPWRLSVCNIEIACWTDFNLEALAHRWSLGLGWQVYAECGGDEPCYDEMPHLATVKSLWVQGLRDKRCADAAAGGFWAHLYTHKTHRPTQESRGLADAFSALMSTNIRKVQCGAYHFSSANKERSLLWTEYVIRHALGEHGPASEIDLRWVA